jgi:hypothetical protein
LIVPRPFQRAHVADIREIRQLMAALHATHVFEKHLMLTMIAMKISHQVHPQTFSDN